MQSQLVMMQSIAQAEHSKHSDVPVNWPTSWQARLRWAGRVQTNCQEKKKKKIEKGEGSDKRRLRDCSLVVVVGEDENQKKK